MKTRSFINNETFLLDVNAHCYLRVLTKNDVSDDYIAWMNDNDVTKYTEQRYIAHTRESVEAFVQQKICSSTDLLLGIYFEKTHVGNIKLGNVSWQHKSADISYFIGNKEFWGKGIASKCVSRIVGFSLNDIGLEKINAGYYENNIGSAKVLEKCGFKLEGRRISNVIFEGKRIDSILVGFTLEKQTHD